MARNPEHCEIRILATILATGELVADLEPEHFANRDHRNLYRWMIDCREHIGTITPVILADYLEAEVGIDLRDWLTLFVDEALHDPALLPSYVAMVHDIRAARSLEHTLETIGHMQVEDADHTREEAIAALERHALGRKARGLLPVSEYLPPVISAIHARHRGDEQPGIRSGIASLDKITGGWQPGDLIILAARPAVGKTALALNFALSAAQANKRVQVISAEQPAEQITQRLIAIATGVTAWKLRAARLLTHEDLDLIDRGRVALAKHPVAIFDHPAPSVSQISAALRANPGDLVIVDYLQRLKAPGQTRPYDRVSAIAQDLKELARTLNVPVIALAQINRQGADAPKMEHLKGSGDIEQEADLIMILDRRDGEAGCSLTLEKNRHGPTGVIELHFHAQSLRFRESATAQANSYREATR